MAEKRFLSLLHANQLIELNGIAVELLNSSSPEVSNYPPTEKFQELFNRLVKEFEWQLFSPTDVRYAEDNSSISTEGAVSCDASIYDALVYEATDYSTRKATITTDYLKKITNPFLNLHNIHIGPTPSPDTNKLKGLIEQLKSRQNELNNESRKAASAIEQHTHVHLNKLEREFKKSVSDLTNSAKTLESDAVQKIQTLSSETQIQFQELVNTQKIQLSELTTKHIDEAIDEKRQLVFEQLEKNSNKLLGKVVVEVDSLSTRVSEEINEFCRLNEALRKTLKYISSDALADASIAQATIEKESADKLRIFGVSWLLLSIFLFLTTFDYEALVDKDGVPQYTLILLRSFFLIVGSAPAFYLLRESARHRTDERRYRQKGIQLATIDGYLAEFEGADRNNVKKELTKHYFHGGDHFVDSSSVDSVQGIYEKVLDRILSSEKNKTTQESQKDTPA
ncbi:hypothetical protein GTU35_003338 [Vibrio fluvialis]|nr:hypothetical protein [Vibrio fluvialis]